MHPTITDNEVDFIVDAIEQIAIHYEEWGTHYIYNKHTNEFIHSDEGQLKNDLVETWFIFGKTE